MVIVKDIIKAIEKRAPLKLQESWDNCGLQWGWPQDEVKGVLACLDVTPEVVQEAIHKGCNVIVSHHPMLFKGLKSIDFTSGQGKMLQTLIDHRITVYSAHTNLDIAEDGLNDEVARRLHLTAVKGLVCQHEHKYYKVCVFVPITHSDMVRQALADHGAGRIGDYDSCSFSTTGEGRFRPLAGANPFLGTAHTLEVVKEDKVEVLIREDQLSEALSAMKSVHPYEAVAYDVVPLHVSITGDYLGRIGTYEEPAEGREWCEFVKALFGKSVVRFGGVIKESIRKVAICTGSGAEFIKAAARQGADVYVTGDVKYHDMQLAKELGILVVDGGHFGTEYIAPNVLERWIQEDLSESVVTYVSEAQKDFFFPY